MQLPPVLSSPFVLYYSAELPTAETNPDKAIELLLRFVEETIPSKSIYIKEAEGQDSQQVPFEGSSQEPVINMMNQIFLSLLNQGRTPENAKAIISNLEPFNNFPHLIDLLN